MRAYHEIRERSLRLLKSLYRSNKWDRGVMKVELNHTESGVHRVSIRGKASKLKDKASNHMNVLQRWNRAGTALAVSEFYRRMRGGGGFKPSWMEEDSDEPSQAGEGKRDYWTPYGG